MHQLNPFEPSGLAPGPVRPLDPETGAPRRPPQGRRGRKLERGLAAAVGLEQVQGRFCGRIAHAISPYNQRSWRCAQTGACLACLADARAGRFTPLAGFVPATRHKLLGLVHFTGSALLGLGPLGLGPLGLGPLGPAACWTHWDGPRRGGSAIYRGFGGTIVARRAAFLLLRGDLGPTVELRQTCTSRAACINPFHVRAPGFGIADVDASVYAAELHAIYAAAQDFFNRSNA